jgi:CheY-like chemotaxis protein
MRLSDYTHCHFKIAVTKRQMVVSEARELYSFDVILMDCRMPDVDGFTCTKKIRDLTGTGKTIPIIAVTAQTAVEDQRKCLNAGMDDYLAKTFTLEQLHQKLCFWRLKSQDPLAPGRQDASPEITLA